MRRPWSDELTVTSNRPFSVHIKNEVELDTIGHGHLSLFLFLQCHHLSCDQSHWQLLFAQSLLGSCSNPGVPSGYVLFVCLNWFHSFILRYLFIVWFLRQSYVPQREFLILQPPPLNFWDFQYIPWYIPRFYTFWSLLIHDGSSTSIISFFSPKAWCLPHE